MTNKEVDKLNHGQKLTLRDGREAVFLDIIPIRKEEKEAFVIVNVINTGDDYGHEESVWPAQIKTHY